VAIEIASHVKIPYADNMLNAFRQKDMSYKHTQNIMYRISSKDYVTYFCSQNNLISYYRKLAKDEGTLIPNTKRNTYKFIEFEKDEIYSQKPSTLLAKSSKNKWYVIAINVGNDSKKYDTIITTDEVTDDVRIEHVELDSNILKHQTSARIISNYPIYNDIFVVLRSTNQQISLHFLSISENRFESVSWDLKDINELLYDMLNNSDILENKDKIVKIGYVPLYKIHYLYGSFVDNTSYVHGIRTYCSIELKGKNYNYVIKDLYIYITIKDGSLKCYWDFSGALIQIFESITHNNPIRTMILEKYIKNPDLFVRTYVINESEKCSKKLYDNECYYIRHQQNKQEIISIGSWLSECQIECIEYYSLYHYKNYYIIIYKSYIFKLAILDREHDFVGIGLSPDFFSHTMFDLLDFKYHASAINNKIVFLSNDLMHLFFIDTKKVDDVFNIRYKEGCKAGFKKNLGDLVYYSSVPERLSLAINNASPEIHKNIAISEIVGSYIDKKSDKLYVAAKYKIEDTEHYGLFMWDMADNGLNFRLVYRTLANILYNSAQNNKRKYVFDVGKSILWESETYGFRRTKPMNLDIVYSESHRFVSMKYNRVSRYVPVPNVFQFETLQCYTKSVKNAAENVIVVYYDCSRLHANSTTSAYHYFVLSSMPLVKKIPTVKI
jgi:hypothetical protein